MHNGGHITIDDDDVPRDKEVAAKEQFRTSLDKIFIFSIIYKGPQQKLRTGQKIDQMHYCAQWWTHHH